MSELALGIDAGGSSTRWLLVSPSGDTVAEGRVGPVSAIELRPGVDTGPAIENLGELAERVAEVGRPSFVVAGVTGLDTGSPEADRLAGFIAERLDVLRDRVAVLGDVITAYLSAFGPGEGVLVYAGTGSVAVHVGRGGGVVRAGGHGYLIDDAGGGYWIGREALKRLLRQSDVTGAPPSGKLASAVFGALGGSDWQTIRTVVYGGGRAKVASLASVVALAAGRGDPIAKDVLAGAGRELARLATVVCGRLGQVLPVALAGGVAASGPALTDALADDLPTGTSLRVSTAQPVLAAADLARQVLAGTKRLPPPPAGPTLTT
ncbi:MAG TPA: BadF/BadG/BcrA/BcrD ATPase family protein [Trueperaceae bacterium]|nr:BadF/BadG/BcrA/BcrD ATPase family protein [Trueperaceae bacterium]